jgi:hypothetical protein
MIFTDFNLNEFKIFILKPCFTKISAKHIKRKQNKPHKKQEHRIGVAIYAQMQI